MEDSNNDIYVYKCIYICIYTYTQTKELAAVWNEKYQQVLGLKKAEGYWKSIQKCKINLMLSVFSQEPGSLGKTMTKKDQEYQEHKQKNGYHAKQKPEG